MDRDLRSGGILLAQYFHDYRQPSFAQLTRILNGVREIGKELALVSIVE